ncbi:DNA polymerase IV [Niveispirillum lacus]|uniref:DNA polymerase IV n=1 Tax=Niveispirillum lacus TaxID=1981099 RepID=A0A255Z8Q3_9PROT|nr:DNA polymerase IV [Niveispirillum lacus]OYQ37284.1 DNA polymerase IV [Niveispirillum lacus]
MPADPQKLHSSAVTDTLCRDCGHPQVDARRCRHCGSVRMVKHPELHRLSIAHIDCDAFYASVEKRDRPELADQPVIVGGGHRGVVSACCYIARLYGVRSAMPMFKALQLCPQAVIIKPDMQKYVGVGRAVRSLMQEMTPLVEAISIDEAFLDLTGTELLHHGSPARTLVRLVRRIETEIGVTASIGLSHNKFLAKLASDLDKPRGFAIIGEAETLAFLAPRPVGMIWGVGKALAAKMAAEGIRTIGQIRDMEMKELVRRYGSMGMRLYHFSRGQDDRRVTPHSPLKSISSETTFNHDLWSFEDLERELWPLAEKVSKRMKSGDHAGLTVTLKLKTPDFKLITRSQRLSSPTQLADRIFRVGRDLLRTECDGRRFRLLGIGCHDLTDPRDADPPDLADPGQQQRAKVERAIDAVRAKLGGHAITKGRSLPVVGSSSDPNQAGEG